MTATVSPLEAPAISGERMTLRALIEVLTRSADWITLDPTEVYTEVTVRLWGKGVIARGEKLGGEIGGTRRLRVHPREFILSRIDARNGAFGLVPAELDGAVVSNDFPCFRADESVLLPEYLGWLSRTRWFSEACKQVSEGTTNRVRLNEKKFLAIHIPLPPMDEQQRIVAKIEHMGARIEEAKGLRNQALKETAVLRRLFYHKAEQEAAKHGITRPVSKIIASHDSGWSPQCEDSPAAPGEWGVLKTTCVQWEGFNATANKALGPGLSPRSDIVVRDGDVLITRAGPVNRVGVACVVRDPPPRRMLSDKIVRLVTREDIVPEFLVLMLGTPSVQEYFRQSKTGLAASQVNISRKKLLSIAISVPPVSEQHRLVEIVDGLQARVDRLKSLQQKTATELDALLPSILDRAFKGEL